MRFRVYGLDRATGEPRDVLIEAADEAAAREAAFKDAIVVERVQRAEPTLKTGSECSGLNGGEAAAAAVFVVLSLVFWLIGAIWFLAEMMDATVSIRPNYTAPITLIGIGFLCCLCVLVTEVRSYLRRLVLKQPDHPR